MKRNKQISLQLVKNKKIATGMCALVVSLAGGLYSTQANYGAPPVAVIGQATAASQSGDLNGDGIVNIRDFSLLLSKFGKKGTAAQGDLDNNGSITALDLGILLGQLSSRTNSSVTLPSSPTTPSSPSTSPKAPSTGQTGPQIPTSPATPPPTSGPTSSGILKLFVRSNTNAAAQARAWRASRPADAALMDKLAAQQSALWVGGYSNEENLLSTMLADAAIAQARPVVVLYGIPFRDGGQYSSGGFANGTAYKAWIDRMAARVGSSPAIIIVEPDAVAMSIPAEKQAERWDALNYAVAKMKSLPNTKVYLDGGTLYWKSSTDMVTRLKSAGIDKADGFAINTSNFVATDKLLTYGREISKGVGNKPFVIDTSRNGNGAWNAPAGTPETWCNPPGRAVGSPPTLTTGVPNVDAFLWLKSPGGSDGACRGATSAGQWMPEYALELVRGAKW